MGDLEHQLMRTQAEAYQLVKANQELVGTLQELIKLARVQNVQELGQFILGNLPKEIDGGE